MESMWNWFQQFFYGTSYHNITNSSANSGGTISQKDVYMGGKHYHTHIHQVNELQLPESPTISDEQTSRMKKRLQQMYLQATLPCPSWMNQGFDFQLDYYYAQLQLESTRHTIELEQIFEEQTPMLLHRILVEGQPGFGKTTLLTKLAYDWAKNVKYLQRFNLVLFLRLRDLQDRDIASALNDLFEKMSPEDVENTIAKNGEQILILLDGYDELPPGKTRNDIIEILYQQKFSDAVVVVTCRTGMFETETEKLRKDCLGFTRRKKFYNKKVIVLGITPQNEKKLLFRCFPPRIAVEILKTLQNPDEPLSILFKCPLIVMLLAFLYNIEEKMEIAATKSKLYLQLLNSLTKYYVGRKEEVEVDNFDVSAIRSIDSETYKIRFSKFGSMVLQLISESKYELDDCELTRHIYNMGFLTMKKSKNLFTTSFRFEPIHISFLDFFAAYYIWQDFRTNGELMIFNEELLQNLTNIFFQTRGTSLVLSFLVGLMEADAHILFQNLLPFAHIFSRTQTGLWRILLESQETEQIIDNLVSFLPANLDSYGQESLSGFSSTNFCQSLIKKGIECSKMKTLTLRTTERENYNLPKNIKLFERIDVEIDANYFSEDVLSEYKSLMQADCCSTLRFGFTGNFEDNESNQKLMTNWLQVFADIDVETRSFFILEDGTCELLNSCINNGALNKIEIHNMHLVLTNSNSDWVKFLVTLIEKHKLQKLRLDIVDKACVVNLKKILKCAVESKHLSSIFLDNLSNTFEIDLQDLTNDGLKEWCRLDLRRISLTCSSPIDNDLEITQLVVTNADSNAVEVLLNSNTSMLMCTTSFMYKIRDITDDSYSESEIVASLSELLLWFDEEDLEEELCSILSHFTEVTKMAICFENVTSLPLELMDCLQQLKLTHFEMWFDGPSLARAGSVSQQLTLSFPWLCDGKTHPLRTVNVYVADTPPNHSDFINPLLECVEKNILEEVGLGWFNNKDAFSDSLNWIDHKKFTIEQVFQGSREDDLQYWRTKYEDGLFDYKVVISKLCVK